MADEQDYTTMTEPQLDDLFVTAWNNEASAFQQWLYYRNLVDEGRSYNDQAFADAKKRLADARAALALLNAEWERRGGWTRYWLVVNYDGHVHRDTHCSTTFPTTQWSLPTQLSGMDEDTMIGTIGHMACTVCYPNAPVHPKFIQSLKEAEAAEAAKKAALCEGSGQQAHNVSRTYSRYATCHVCGRLGVSVTQSNRLRGHKTPEAEKAAALAAANKDAKKITAPDGSMLRSRYGDVKTVISAWRELVADYETLGLRRKRDGGEVAEYEASVERLSTALAAKLGITVEEVMEQAETKLAAKKKREGRQGW